MAIFEPDTARLRAGGLGAADSAYLPASAIGGGALNLGRGGDGSLCGGNGSLFGEAGGEAAEISTARLGGGGGGAPRRLEPPVCCGLIEGGLETGGGAEGGGGGGALAFGGS